MAPFPLLFTLPPSNRHEILLLDTPTNLKSLNKQIVSLISTSPNCAEFMSKYKKSDESAPSTQQITELRVHWADSGRDRKVWPEYTVVTEENWGAVCEVLRAGIGRDVLEVKVDG